MGRIDTSIQPIMRNVLNTANSGSRGFRQSTQLFNHALSKRPTVARDIVFDDDGQSIDMGLHGTPGAIIRRACSLKNSASQ